MTLHIVPKGSEAVRRAVAATLRAQLPGVLTEIWQAWAANDAADGLAVPLPTIKKIYARNKARMAEYPCIVVTGPGGKLDEDGANDWQGWSHDVRVVVDLVADNEELADVLVNRILQGVWEVLGTNQQLDGSIESLLNVTLAQYATATYNEPLQKAGAGSRLHVVGVWKTIVRVEDAF